MERFTMKTKIIVQENNTY